MDAQKLTEEFQRPLTPEQTLPKQKSSKKPMDSKITLSEEWKSSPASSRARRGLVSEESDDFKQKTLKGSNSPHYKEIKTKTKKKKKIYIYIYNQTDSWARARQ